MFFEDYHFWPPSQPSEPDPSMHKAQAGDLVFGGKLLVIGFAPKAETLGSKASLLCDNGALRVATWPGSTAGIGAALATVG